MDDRIERTRAWVKKLVIGLNLCPFAEAPFSADRIRFILEETDDLETLAAKLLEEAKILAASPTDLVETTVLIHPNALTDFLQYNDFQGVAEQVLRDAELEGVIQVASFHPDYQFADTEKDDPQNFTNRSPYPMLHLLREESVTRAVEGHPDAEGIPERNIAVMRKLGRDGIRDLLGDA